MDCNVSRYCVSNLTRQLSELGMRRVIDSWNAHRIPGMVKTVTEKKNHKLSSVAQNTFYYRKRNTQSTSCLLATTSRA